jgi:hypothetical protein
MAELYLHSPYVFMSWSLSTKTTLTLPYSKPPTDVGISFKLNSRIRWSQWPRRLRHEISSLAKTLGSWVWIPLEARMSAFFKCLCCPVEVAGLRGADLPSKGFYRLSIRFIISQLILNKNRPEGDIRQVRRGRIPEDLDTFRLGDVIGSIY